MPIHLGIACGCGRVHFIASSSRIEVSHATESGSVYKLTCFPDCSAITYFSHAQLRRYSLSELVFRRSYANLGEYHVESRTYAARKRAITCEKNVYEASDSKNVAAK